MRPWTVILFCVIFGTSTRDLFSAEGIPFEGQISDFISRELSIKYKAILGRDFGGKEIKNYYNFTITQKISPLKFLDWEVKNFAEDDKRTSPFIGKRVFMNGRFEFLDRVAKLEYHKGKWDDLEKFQDFSLTPASPLTAPFLFLLSGDEYRCDSSLYSILYNKERLKEVVKKIEIKKQPLDAIPKTSTGNISFDLLYSVKRKNSKGSDIGEVYVMISTAGQVNQTYPLIVGCVTTAPDKSSLVICKFTYKYFEKYKYLAPVLCEIKPANTLDASGVSQTFELLEMNPYDKRDEVEIDPASARKIYDGDAKMEIER